MLGDEGVGLLNATLAHARGVIEATALVAATDALHLSLFCRLWFLSVLLLYVRFAHQTKQASRPLEQREHLTATVIASAKTELRGAIGTNVI